MSEHNNTGFLYFAVGALFVAVLGFGYLYIQNESADNGVAAIETSSGEESSSSFSLSIDDNGVSASTSKEEN